MRYRKLSRKLSEKTNPLQGGGGASGEARVLALVRVALVRRGCRVDMHVQPK